MGASIDLRRAHLHRNYGDLVAVWSWLNEERALFLIPRFRKGAPWFVVLEPAAHEWDDRDPRLIMLVIARAVKACDVLGFEPTPANARRIIRIVNDAIPELVAMPHRQEPEKLPGSHGSMILLENGREVGGEEIRLDDTGVQYG